MMYRSVPHASPYAGPAASPGACSVGPAVRLDRARRSGTWPVLDRGLDYTDLYIYSAQSDSWRTIQRLIINILCYSQGPAH